MNWLKAEDTKDERYPCEICEDEPKKLFLEEDSNELLCNTCIKEVEEEK